MKQEFKVRLPERVPMEYVWPVLAFLFALQMLEGTKLLTSLVYCAFTLVIVDAFNVSGGLVYPSGAYIFFCGLLTAILAGVAKVAFGEPLDSNLFDAQKSLSVYLAGACTLWVAARINVKIRRKKGLLAPLQLLPDRVEQVALGAAIFGQFGGIIIPAAYISTYNQMNVFPSLALFLFAYGRARKTDGYRTFSVLSFLIWGWTTVMWGILAFSKEGMFRPAVAWALGAVIAGYRMTWKRAFSIGTAVLLATTFLAPVSQVGRVYRYEANAQQVAWDLLTHPLRTREEYQKQVKSVANSSSYYHWFDQSEGLLDRLTMLPIDDALIRRTDRGYSPGIVPIMTYAVNMIPRYLVGEKTVYHWGNRYAHEIGMLGVKDMTTGISFSPFGDGYHCMQWWGVTAISLPIFVIMFVVCDSLTGNTKDTIWASIYVLLFGHASAEGMMNTPFAAVSTYAFMVVAAAVLSRYFLPVVGSLLMPPKRGVPVPLSADRWRLAPASPLPGMPRTIEEKL